MTGIIVPIWQHYVAYGRGLLNSSCIQRLMCAYRFQANRIFAYAQDTSFAYHCRQTCFYVCLRTDWVKNFQVTAQVNNGIFK